MTRDEILALKDQALVEAVAEKVMGWTRSGEFSFHDIGRLDLRTFKFNPLTDENHLAEVLNKMVDDEFNCNLRKTNYYIHDAELGFVKDWEIWFWKGNSPTYRQAMVYGESRPITLLRAALLAIDEKEAP